MRGSPAARPGLGQAWSDAATLAGSPKNPPMNVPSRRGHRRVRSSSPTLHMTKTPSGAVSLTARTLPRARRGAIAGSAASASTSMRPPRWRRRCCSSMRSAIGPMERIVRSPPSDATSGGGVPTRADHRHLDVVVAAVEGARPRVSSRCTMCAASAYRAARSPGRGSAMPAASASPALPTGTEAGLEPCRPTRLHLQRRLGELDRRAEQVVGERRGQQRPLRDGGERRQRDPEWG